MKHSTSFKIGARSISIKDPTYFVADIAANHDGELTRAKDLIYRAKEAGADCAKFQHFLSDKIVSSVGFAKMTTQLSHQSSWDKSVSEIYDQYHTRREWTQNLIEACAQAEIEFMTTPYDFEAIDMFSNLLNAFKIGSGDITFFAAIKRIAESGKPILLATGAATMEDVEAAVSLVLKENPQLCLMQCNTNYTGSLENFQYVNINVLRAFSARWPGMVLGLSDHTPGHSAVLGAVTLGARIIEKHFTDDNSRKGPDHKFALSPTTWHAMVRATRQLEAALGDGVKRVEGNELETVVIQRRALRYKMCLPAGTTLAAEQLESLRPCPEGAVTPADLNLVLNRTIKVSKNTGEEVRWEDLE